MRQYFDSSPRFILEINVCELLSVVVANNEARLLSSMDQGGGKRRAVNSAATCDRDWPRSARRGRDRERLLIPMTGCS
jgi:hypothetical protein